MSETAPEVTTEDAAPEVHAPVEQTGPEVTEQPEVFEPDPMDVYKPSGSVDPEPVQPAVHDKEWVASNGLLYCPVCGLPAPCPSAPVVEE